ncbi:MAG: hypothetical protein CTY25_09585 [Methylobacterium sp.]|nr:MAG: hypothetical protein CTY25_09585 [Methylobacterium sp.]
MRHAALLARSLGLGATSAASMAIWIALQGEIWNWRAVALIAIWFGGGFLGTWIAAGLVGILARLGRPNWATRMRGFLFLLGFLLGGALSFLLYSRIAAGVFITGLRHFVMWATFGSAELMGLFFYTAPLFLLPWMAPLLVVAGYLLIPAPRRPEPASRTEVEPGARQV